ncbi:MAG: polysaccharide deacetylase family protein, partial [Gaiellales bacterium]
MPGQRALVLPAAGALALASAWCWPAPAPLLPSIAPLLGIPCRLSTGGVAITFDDGPHPEGTPAVLESLAAAGATATFYLVGEQVERWPRVAARIADEGHEIALHGQIHRLLLRRPTRTLRVDLTRALDVIGEATGRVPSSYRPPYGVFSAGALALVQELGLAPLLWSRWGRDWGARETPELIARRATRNLGDGDVVLLHDADHYSAPGSW